MASTEEKGGQKEEAKTNRYGDEMLEVGWVELKIII